MRADNKKANKPIILVVDDTPENIDVLKGVLIADHVIRPAPNGLIALKAVHVQPRPDLILLDIMMPGMDGYEVCRRLKADPLTRDIPVIFVTAKAEVEDEVTGLRLGAVDYITKPFSVPIVQARVKTHLALRTATQVVERHNQHLLEERDLIENILLKMRRADDFDARHLRYLISPVEVTAGDMLLATFTPDGRQWVMLGDFTGHGLSAAVGGPLVTYIFHQMARQGASGEALLTEINRQLNMRLPVGMFFAVTLLEMAPERERATYWNAGLPNILLLRRGAILDHFPSALPPLGIVKELPRGKEGVPLVLESQDRLYIYSDGIIEAANWHREMFGMQGLEGFLVRMVAEDLALDALIPVLDAYVGSTTHEDDITLVEVTA